MLVPIESAYVTSYYSVIVSLVLSCTVSEILHVFVLLAPPEFHPNFGVFSLHQIARVEDSDRISKLSYLAVKLFSKNSNLCDHGT